MLGQPNGGLGAPRARVLDVVGLVEDQRPRLELGQPLRVRVEDVVVEHDDLRLERLLRPGDLGATVEHRDAALRQPDRRLALPHQLHARRAHHHGREGVVDLQRGQRLHGLAEALLVGDERAPALQRVAHPRPLEGVELTAQLEAVQLGVLRVRQRHRRGCAVVLGHELLEHRGHALVYVERRPRRDELGQVRRQRRVRGHRDRPGAVAAEVAPGPVHQARLGQAPELLRVLGVPEREQRHVGLAMVAYLEAQLGGGGGQPGIELARARAREVIQVDPFEAGQPPRAGAAERQQELALARGQGALQGVGRVSGERAHQERPGALVRDHGDGRAPAVGLVQPLEHLRRGLEVREAAEQLGHELADAGVRRDAPVLATPVEPALGQPLDGLVELLVEREVEDQLRSLARILVAQPDSAVRYLGLDGERLGGQTDELSAGVAPTRARTPPGRDRRASRRAGRAPVSSPLRPPRSPGCRAAGRWSAWARRCAPAAPAAG